MDYDLEKLAETNPLFHQIIFAHIIYHSNRKTNEASNNSHLLQLNPFILLVFTARLLWEVWFASFHCALILAHLFSCIQHCVETIPEHVTMDICVLNSPAKARL